MIRVRILRKPCWICGIAMVLMCILSGPQALGQYIHGNGIQRFSHGAVDGMNYFREVSVNAWLDDDGGAHGIIVWRGDVVQTLPGGDVRFGGPANTYVIEVTGISVVGNSAEVFGIVITSPNGVGDGGWVLFTFTDNEGSDVPDLLNGAPIEAGNYIIRE